MAVIAKKREILIPLRNPNSPPSKGTRFRNALIEAALAPVVFVVVAIYKVCFRWWLEPLSARSSQRKLAAELRLALPFLFTDHAAKVDFNLGDPPERNYNIPWVTIAAETVLLRFVRGRGDFAVEITSKYAPKNWQYISDVIRVVDQQNASTEEKPTLYSLRNIDGILRPRFEQLKDALSEGRYEATLNEVVRLHNQEVDERVAQLRERGIEPIFWTPK